MPVNPFSGQTRVGWQLWPLFTLALGLSVAGYAAWQQWPQILLQSILWQKALHQQMSTLLQQVASHPQQAGLTLIGFSLLYGVLHALGPGHGKVVIATFLATHPGKVKTSLQLTLAAALLQGLVAVLLVTLMLVVLGFSSRQLHLSSYWLEKASYLLVAGLGLWLCWRALGKIRQALRATPGLRILRLTPAPRSISAPNVQRLTPTHQHSASCGCAHQHVANSEMLERAVTAKTTALVVLSMGLRPCSGAIMMLLFAKVIGVYGWGVLSAMAMAAGTALTVSAIALLVQLSRTLALRLSRGVTPAGWQKMGWSVLSLAGGIVLVATGVLLWLSAQPAISGGIRPLLR